MWFLIPAGFVVGLLGVGGFCFLFFFFFVGGFFFFFVFNFKIWEIFCGGFKKTGGFYPAPILSKIFSKKKTKTPFSFIKFGFYSIWPPLLGGGLSGGGGGGVGGV
ncbi:MAG: hypothetical protein IPK77_00065 [Cellvibrio sp.]|nr:hypothetical protein [Cellvibrio sp.]